jgi:hypothetical protein
MASVTGGQHIVGGTAGHAVVGAGSEHGAPAPLGAFSLYLISHPQASSGGPDTIIGGAPHPSVTGGAQAGASGGGPETGAGHSGGFDTGTSVHGLPMAGEPRPASDQVIATHTHDGGSTIMHLADGSSITVIGAHQIDSTLFR